MFTTRRSRNTIFALGSLVLVLALIPSFQCGRIKDIDTAIWGTSDAPAESQPGEAPPVLELIASGLAACGFGGMAAWLRRTSNNSKKTLAELNDRVAKLETKRLTDKLPPSEN